MAIDEMAKQVVYCAHIYLADNEWGSTLMEEVASEYVASHSELKPIQVEVTEHAGWFLVFTGNGEIVGTANDQAVLGLKAREFREKYNSWPREFVESIRREHAACKKCGHDRDIVGGGICGRCKIVELQPRNMRD